MIEDAAGTPVESPLPPAILRGLGDRSYDKRKAAALEVTALMKSLQEAGEKDRIGNVITLLAQEFTRSRNVHHRKGGLIGLAASAIGLVPEIDRFLHLLIPPVLECFDDPESRVCYYACESLYNISKVARTSVLRYFNQIFDGLCKLFAHVDADVKNGANLLDRLIKDIVTETETFDIESFIPLLQKHIKRTKPYIRQLLVGWISVLDAVPDINMLDYLPEFLDGLFNMLSDSNKEIKQAADNAISEFLREIKEAELVEFGPMVNILVGQCRSKERSNRLTALKWLIEFIHLGGSRLVLFYAGVLGSVMYCISDQEPEISQTAKTANRLLMNLVKATAEPFDLLPLFHTLTVELLSEHVTTRVASLHWINMLIQCKGEAARQAIGDILPALLTKISDPADEVVLINLQVLARLSLVQAQFVQVLHALVELFLEDRSLLETRGALVIRKLCALLDSRSIYLSLSAILSSRPELEFVSHMVQTLNLILLTAPELSVLRKSLKECFQAPVNREMTTNSSSGRQIESDKGGSSNATASVASSKEQDRLTFVQLFRCWCHNPVATFSLCLLAQAYDLSARLVLKFSEVDVTVGFLMQVDKLVQLLESPIFVHLRLQLLDVASKRHADLLRTLYGLLMLLPQSQAYKTLSDRLAAVSSLHMHIGFSRANNLSALVHPSPATPSSSSSSSAAIGCDQQTITEEAAAIEAEALDAAELLERFDDIQWRHSSFRMSILRQTSLLDAAASFVPSSVERMDDIDGLDAPSSDTTNLGRPS